MPVHLNVIEARRFNGYDIVVGGQWERECPLYLYDGVSELDRNSSRRPCPCSYCTSTEGDTRDRVRPIQAVPVDFHLILLLVPPAWTCRHDRTAQCSVVVVIATSLQASHSPKWLSEKTQKAIVIVASERGHLFPLNRCTQSEHPTNVCAPNELLPSSSTTGCPTCTIKARPFPVFSFQLPVA